MRTLLIGICLGLCLATVAHAGDLESRLEAIATLRSNSQFEEAAEQARALLQEDLNGDLETAMVIDEVVESLFGLGKFEHEETLQLAQRSLELREGFLQANDPPIANSLVLLGRLHYLRSEYDLALPYLERALEIREVAVGPIHVDVAECLTWLGRTHRSLSRHEDSQAAIDRALAIHATEVPAGDPRTANLLVDKAVILMRGGDFDAAQQAAEQALAQLEAAKGADHPDVANALNILGILEGRRGNHATRVEYNRRALDLLEKALGPDHPRLYQPLTNLGNTYADQDEYAAALELYDRSLALCIREFGEDDPRTANVLLQLSKLNLNLGNVQEARDAGVRALGVIERTLGPNHMRMIVALERMGSIEAGTGNFDKAREYFQRQRDATRALHGPGHTMEAYALYQLAYAERMTGNAGGAIEYYEEALAIREQSLGSDHRLVGAILEPLGQAYRTMGRLEEAAEALDKCLPIRVATFGPQSRLVGNVLNAQALVLADQGHIEVALDKALAASDMARQKLQRDLSTLGEGMGTIYAAERSGGVGRDTAITLASKHPQEAKLDRVLDEVMAWRALVVDELVARQEILRDLESKEGNELRAQRAEVMDGLNRLALIGVYDESEPDLLRKRESIERKLAALSGPFLRECERDRLRTKDLLAGLPANSVVLSYVNSYDYVAHVRRYVVLVAADQGLSIADLGSAKEIDDAVQAWRSEVGQGYEGADRSAEEAGAAVYAAGERLRQLALDPVRDRLASAEHVFIVPDATLHLVNFAALPLPDQRYVVEDPYVLHYANAERDLVPLAPSTNEGLFMVGNPDFDTNESNTTQLAQLDSDATAVRGNRSSCPGFAQLDFLPLPASAEEVNALAALWGTSNIVRLTGQTANESAFRKLVSGRRIVHLATHGFFLDESCVVQNRGVRGVGGLVSSDEQSLVANQNPMLRCGLSLAGANARTEETSVAADGILTGEEIATLDLEGTEWAVLSACDTGVGDVQRSEGVFGLQRAFRLAGARTVIMSLWSVGDAWTRDWMTELYRSRLVDGKSTGASVKAATLSVLNQRRAENMDTHPYYWAAFVATGQP